MAEEEDKDIETTTLEAEPTKESAEPAEEANKSNDSDSGGKNSGEDAGQIAEKLLISEWMQRSPGDGDGDPLACKEKGWHFGLFDGCCNGGAAHCCQRWWCLPCMYSRALGIALDQNCCLCCFCTQGWYWGWLALPCCRQKIREKYGIEGGNLCLDIVKCLFCHPCVAQQLVQEVNSREGIHIGPFGDPEGTFNVKIDCGNDIPNAKVGTDVQADNVSANMSR
jgi:Cys-rich protein (TIGR01571 family)